MGIGLIANVVLVCGTGVLYCNGNFNSTIHWIFSVEDMSGQVT